MVKGMKHTEIGLIPKDWEVFQLHEVGNSSIGLTYNPSCVKPFGTLVLRSSNIQNSQLSFNNNVYVQMQLSERVIVVENDILVCVRNGSRQLIGKCALIDKKTEGSAFGAFMSIFRTNKDIDPRFCFYQFQSNIIQNQINKTLGATINQITNRDLKAFQIPLPPTKREQSIIAQSLSDTDILINTLEKLIAKKKAIRTGSIQQLLKPEKNWIEYNLGKDATLKARIGWQGLTKSEYKNIGDFYLVTGTDFLSGNIDWENCVYVEESRYSQDKNIQLKINDVLITKDGTIGKVALVRELKKPTTLNSGVFVIRPINNSFDPKFFFYVLSSKIFKDFLDQLSAGSTINHLYQKDFVNFKFFAPKEIKEQKRIAQILSDMDEEILALKTKLKKQKQFKQGMMQVLLTGKIRLI